MARNHLLLNTALTEILERALNSYLGSALHSRELLAPIVGKIIAFHLKPWGSFIYLCPTESNVQVLTDLSEPPDVTLSGTLSAFAKLGWSGASRQSLATGEIEIEGDLDTARHFQNLFAQLDLNLEVLLARYLGSSFASNSLNLLSNGIAWTRHAADTLQQNLAEYWQEETRELPTQIEADAFYREVDRIREDSDRLEARIARLQDGVPATTPSL